MNCALLFFALSLVIIHGLAEVLSTQNADSTRDISSKRNLLPNKRYCGKQHSDDYILPEGSDVVLSELPWLAQIKIRRSKYWEEYGCTGSLINERYVLTAGWCVKNPAFIPVEVRLGEFHIINKTDCIADAYGMMECSAITDFGIEKVIPHPDYDAESGDNDIGLIRLSSKIGVIWTDYIRPICLPQTHSDTQLEIGNGLMTSGWGRLQHSYKEAFQKVRLYSNLTSYEYCQDKFSSINISMTYSKEEYFCAEPTLHQICTEENHGSPVMVSRRYQWYQHALVTTKTYETTCINSTPVVYTNVTYHLNWILNNLEPATKV